jgi:hypothetical protein
MNNTPTSNRPGLRRRLGKAVGRLLVRGSQKRADTPQIKPQSDRSVEDADTATSVPQRTVPQSTVPQRTVPPKAVPVAPVENAEQSYRNLIALRESYALCPTGSVNAKTSVTRVVRSLPTKTLVYENPATFGSGSLPRGIYRAAPPVPGAERYSGQRSRQNSTGQHSQHSLDSRPSTLNRLQQNSQLSQGHTPSGSSGYSSLHTRQNSDGSATFGRGDNCSQWLLYSNPATYSASSVPRRIFGGVQFLSGSGHSSVERSRQNSTGQYNRRSMAGRSRQNSQLSATGSSGYGSMHSSMHTRQNSDGNASGHDDDTAPGRACDNRKIYWSAPLSPVSEHSSTSGTQEQQSAVHHTAEI